MLQVVCGGVIAKKRYPVPVIWTFRHYVDANGVSDVRATYDRGRDKLKPRFLSRLRTLANLPFDDWHETYWKPLKGEGSGLEELRFKANNVEQRPLGFRSGDTEFTILFWATEKGGKFVPLSACTKALERKAEVLADRNRTDDLWLILE